MWFDYAVKSDSPSAPIAFSCRVMQIRLSDRGKCTRKYTLVRKRIKHIGSQVTVLGFLVPNVLLTQLYSSNMEFSVFDSSGAHCDEIVQDT